LLDDVEVFGQQLSQRLFVFEDIVEKRQARGLEILEPA